MILNNLGQNEFFIIKAIGWSLRNYSKVNPDWVGAFIERYREQLSPLSIREGSKYLPSWQFVDVHGKLDLCDESIGS